MMKEYPSKSAVAICLSGVKDACDGTYINDATGTAQLLDSTKASISGSSVSFTASGSNGVYDAAIPDTVTLTSYDFIYLEISLTKSSSLSTYMLIPMRVAIRQDA